MAYILQTHHLTKTIGGRDLVRDVNLHVKQGEIYGFLGPNGAGKTTVMRLITNLWKPSWGESYRQIAARVGAFAQEKVREHAGQQIIVVSHESPIWSYRHLLETGHPEHNMLLRHTALASVTSITYDSQTGSVMSITYVDPAAGVR